MLGGGPKQWGVPEGEEGVWCGRIAAAACQRKRKGMIANTRRDVVGAEIERLAMRSRFSRFRFVGGGERATMGMGRRIKFCASFPRLGCGLGKERWRRLDQPTCRLAPSGPSLQDREKRRNLTKGPARDWAAACRLRQPGKVERQNEHKSRDAQGFGPGASAVWEQGAGTQIGPTASGQAGIPTLNTTNGCSTVDNHSHAYLYVR
jgi:hypothetical protein